MVRSPGRAVRYDRVPRTGAAAAGRSHWLPGGDRRCAVPPSRRPRPIDSRHDGAGRINPRRAYELRTSPFGSAAAPAPCVPAGALVLRAWSGASSCADAELLSLLCRVMVLSQTKPAFTELLTHSRTASPESTDVHLYRLATGSSLRPGRRGCAPDSRPSEHSARDAVWARRVDLVARQFTTPGQIGSS